MAGYLGSGFKFAFKYTLAHHNNLAKFFFICSKLVSKLEEGI
jgi:hypothetical protein